MATCSKLIGSVRQCRILFRQSLFTVGGIWQPKMWDIRSGEKASKYARPDGYVANLDIDFSLDGSKVVTSSKDGTIRIWDAASGKQEKLIRIHNGKGDVTTARFTPEGRHVITLSSNGVCWILRVEANFNAE